MGRHRSLRAKLRIAPSLVLLAGLLAAPAQNVVLAQPPGAFGVQCGFSHASKDDPIVHPGDAGAAHKHAFYGNTTTDAYSTRKTLMAGETLCTDAKDFAATWAPVVLIKKHGEWRQLRGYRERTYYFPAIRDAIAPITNLPANMKLIGGNPNATSRKQNPAVRWWCGDGSPERAFPYDCRPYVDAKQDGVRAIIDFPFCWDGVNKDSPDHVSHVIYSDPSDTTPHVNPAQCPSSHPKYVPAISVRIHLPIKDPCAGAKPCGPNDGGKNVRLKLSSGPYWTMHADFWNAWVQTRLNRLTDKCLRAHIDCGIIGVPGTADG